MNTEKEMNEQDIVAADFYNGYDYNEFWKGRKYEDQADRSAVLRLFKKIYGTHETIVDLGAGTGRMIPVYENLWKNAILIEPSSEQLERLQHKVMYKNRVNFLLGTGENIPLPPESCDTILCIRVFHHIRNPALVIKEVHRVLKPKGYFIVEIPNKLHFKNRIVAAIKRNIHYHSYDKKYIGSQAKNITFVNHNPKAIRGILEKNGFYVIHILSVSNFRSRFFKIIIPSFLLVRIEKVLQKPLASIWFGPSIYFLAQKM